MSVHSENCFCEQCRCGRSYIRNRVPVPTATARRSPSRAELVAERTPIDPWAQAQRHAELSRLYVSLGIAEMLENCFEKENSR